MPDTYTKAPINYYPVQNCRGDIKVLSAVVKEALDTTGYIVIQDYDIDPGKVEESGTRFLELAELVGEPISHDVNNSIIWDIKSNPKSKSNIKTYSEHSHEADLHTDSQYSFYPEDYFGLLTLKKADCGGGLSYLLSLADILSELRQHPDGESIESTLREQQYPFIVPNVFKKSEGEEQEYNFGPILRDNEIRFRVDTFEKAILARPEFCTDEQLYAYRALKSIVLNSKSTMYFHLEPRDLIFINNKTMLHGRSQFVDHTRHLLRIRLNKRN